MMALVPCYLQTFVVVVAVVVVVAFCSTSLTCWEFLE